MTFEILPSHRLCTDRCTDNFVVEIYFERIVIQFVKTRWRVLVKVGKSPLFSHLVAMKIVPIPVTNQIADALRQRILKCELQPGDRLVESALCAELGVSRPSLREAMADRSAVLFASVPQLVKITSVE